jgi:hypothetical protein
MERLLLFVKNATKKKKNNKLAGLTAHLNFECIINAMV